ncbi:4Fe-4S ferredoxin [Bacteroidia bacterium]|nr:4Fe-4S ferredoxin [Bacteroidia bacterium]
MPANTIESFLKQIKPSINEKTHRIYSESLYEHYARTTNSAEKLFKDYDLLKQRAVFAKTSAINKLEDNLKQFEFAFTKRKGKILWATDAEMATSQIIKILQSRGVSSIVKTNSKTFEEINLREKLLENNISIEETELNSIYNNIEKQNNPISDYTIFSDKIDNVARTLQSNNAFSANTWNDVAEQMKENIAEKCTKSEVCITGANFLVSDIGGVVICENEGNVSLSIANTKMQIIIVGVDKMITNIADIDKFMYLLSANTHETLLPHKINILTGPRQEGESQGAEELIVVIIDNGRTDVMKREKYREAYNCIHCGACNHVCQVYHIIGQDAYKGVDTGPRGNVVNPLIGNFEEDIAISFACSMCKKCTDICPMNIPLHKLILYNRKEAVDRGENISIKPKIFSILKKMVSSRKEMDKKYNMFMLKFLSKKTLKDYREYPDFVDKSYNTSIIQKTKNSDKEI